MANASYMTMGNNTCGGMLTADPNGLKTVLADGNVPANGSCSIVIEVVGTMAGSSINHTGPVASLNANDGADAQATLTVTSGPLLNAPTVTKAFLPASVTSGGTSQMTITLTNPNAEAITGVRFGDNYPAGMMNTISDAVVSNSCGGTLTADSNGGRTDLVNGIVPANGSCSVVINVTSPALGDLVNQTGPAPSGNAQSGDSASATLTVTGGSLKSAPTVTKTFSPASVAVGGTSQMTITLTNPNSAAITGAQFTDTYPAGMANAASGAVVSNSCGGTVTADNNGLATALASGTVPANGSCSVVVNVIGTMVGSSINHTGSVKSGNANEGVDAQATLTTLKNGGSLSAPTVTKVFSPSSVTVGGTSQMTITLTNPNAQTITGVQFADNYPAGMANAPFGAGLSNTCGGMLTADNGDLKTALANAAVPANGSCSVVVNVVGTMVGSIVNHTGMVTSATAQDGLDAQATLTVTSGPLLNAPTVTKAFSPSSVTAGGTSQMTITLTNPNAQAITSVQFADTYPNGMANATSGVVVSNSCGGTLTADSNDSTATLANGTVPANGSCSVVVNVISTALGNLVNNTGSIASANANNGANASATLTVNSGSLKSAPTVTKAFSPASVMVGGASQMTITLQNSNAQVITGVQFTDNYPAGMANAASGVVVSNSCGGLLTAGSNDIKTALANGTVPAKGSCSVVVNVVGTMVGSSTNHTGSVKSGNANEGVDAQATLMVTNGTLLSPLAVGDGVVVTSGASVNIVNGNAISVLTNDFNPNSGTTMTAALVGSGPAHGQLVSFNEDGSFTYKNNGDAAGSDSFQYKACAQGTNLCSAATVTITILPVGVPLPTVQLPEATNDAALVNVNQSTSQLFDGSFTVLANDLDPNVGGTLVASHLGNGPAYGNLLFNLQGQPNGSFTYTNTISAATDAFQYQACDNLYGACSLATVTITILDAGQPQPTVLLPIVVDDAMQVTPGGTQTVVVGGGSTVLWNDTDPNNANNDNSTLQAWLIGGGPSHGELVFNSIAPGDGSFTYQNNPNDPATSDSFAYQACDTLYGACASAIVSIEISSSAPVNHVPVANSDTADVAHGGIVSVLVGGAASVLANDTDQDPGETLTLKAFVLGSGTQHGTLTLDTNGTFTYSNNAADSAAVDSFEYEACDVHGACTSTSVMINIGTANGSNPAVTCNLAAQVYLAGATSPDGTTNIVSIDMTKLFAPPAGNSLNFSFSGLPTPPLTLDANAGLLGGNWGTGDAGIYSAVLTATAMPANTSASETVKFTVLDPADHIFRNGFDAPPQHCQ